MANEHGENIKPYSGTRAELENPVLAGHGAIIPWFLDLPFSLVADTLILPFVLFQSTPNAITCETTDRIGENGKDAIDLTLTIRDKDITKVHYDRSIQVSGPLGPLDRCIFIVLTSTKDAKWERKNDITSVEFGGNNQRSLISVTRLSNGYKVDLSKTQPSVLCRNGMEIPEIIEIETGNAQCRIHGSNPPINRTRKISAPVI